jgi:tetratricopeptide (TPR) repeat protein
VQAAALWEECLEQFRKESDKDGIAAALYGLGRVAHRRGDYRRAKELLDESLALSREMGEKHSIATALDGLGRMAHSQGDYARAAAFHAESLTLRREAGAKRGIAESLEGLAGVLAAAQDQPAVAEKAARLLGAAEAVRETIGAPLPPVERSDHDRHVAAVHARLSEEAFAAAWAKGRAMTLEQAIVYVQEETPN